MPGTLSSFGAIPGTASVLRHFVLLTNGKVLALSLGLVAHILEPDRKGKYQAGTWRRIADPPFEMLYGAIYTQNDGKVVFDGGEIGFNAGVFDPVTETWTSSTYSFHRPHGLLNDGTPVFGTGDLVDEVSMILLPDGRLLSFGKGTDTKVHIRATDGTYSRPDQASALAAFPEDIRNGQTAARGVARNWTSRAGYVNYELGAAVWMNKISKAVLVGGDGFMYTYDPATSTLARPCAIGWSSTSNRHLLGTIRSANNGQTLATVGAAGTIILDTTLALASNVNEFVTAVNAAAATAQIKRAITVVTSEGSSFFQMAMPSYSSAALPFATFDSVANTLTIKVTPGFGIHGSTVTSTVLSTGMSVYWGNPTLRAMDAGAAVLPNGDLFIVCGSENYAGGDFPGYTQFMVWDGTSTPPVPVSGGECINPSFEYEPFPLPDGTIMVPTTNLGVSSANFFPGTTAGTGGTLYRLYTPTVGEATPISGSRPALTSFPTTVDQGGQYVIAGTGLTGVNEGGYFGDDRNPRTNFPIIRFTSTANGDIYYGRTWDFSYRGINPGQASTCRVQVPNMPSGTYDVHVITNGVPSATAVSVAVGSPLVAGTSPTLINPYAR